MSAASITDAGPAATRPWLAGMILAKDGLKKFLKVTPCGLLRTDHHPV